MKLLQKLGTCLAVLGVTFCSSCTKKESVWKSTDKVKIVATTTMVADLARQIGGDHVEVHGLMDDGIDPHAYESTPSDVVAVKSADVVLYSGLDLEHNLAEMLGQLDYSLAVTAGMKKGSLIFPSEDLEGYADPHVWGNPILWAEAVAPVVKLLSEKDAENKEAYQQAGDAYIMELKKLNTWAKSRMEEIPFEQRVLVTSHDAFMYLSQAYGIEVKAIDGLAPDDKAGPQKVKALIDFIKSRQLKVIFPEHAVNAKSVKSIAQDAGVAVSERELFSDATGKLGEMETANGETYDVGTYIGMQKHNVNAIVEGLK